MRGIGISDLHLGFRAFPSKLFEGRNAREQDVENAWARAIDVIVDAQPHLVTIAGDVFDHVKPDFHAVKEFRDGIGRIVYDTDAHVVIIPGNHCMPRTVETLTPNVVVDDMPNVHLITEPRRLLIEVESGEMVSIACFPFVALTQEQKYSLDPDPAADVNVLLMHAAVRAAENGDLLPYFYGGEQSLDVGREADRWDVIAVGDYHEFRRLHPSAIAFYSGSIERTSSNFWPEKSEKGVVRYDTSTKQMELLEIPTRPVVDLSLAHVTDLAMYDGQPAFIALNDSLEALRNDLAPGVIARLTVPNFPTSDRDSIHWGVVKQLKEKCFHFELKIDWVSTERSEFGDRRTRVHRCFEDDVNEYFKTDDEDVRACAFQYLQVA